MIAVIADDLTGAAEIGGIGLKFGLTVEINHEVNPATTADLLVVNTNSRSGGESEAVEAVTKACRAIKEFGPELVFIKIDSVMRGHILAELEAEMQVLDMAGALIIPANPHLGRTLVNEQYLVHGVPVHQTSFAADPEFPVTGANVNQMLRTKGREILVKKKHEAISETGIMVGEVETANDLKHWASVAPHRHLLVGSSVFFSALLDHLKFKTATQPNSSVIGKPVLFVSGTTFSVNANHISAIHNAGGPVSYVPQNIVTAPEQSMVEVERWASQVSTLLTTHGRAIMAVDQVNTLVDMDARMLRQNMALVVKSIFEKVEVEELVIEGGATAASILCCLNINTLFPVEELGHGIIRSRAMYHQNIHVTLKPGSYPWGEKLWVF